MRILLVEDERSAARMIAKGLREHGHAVDVVGDGASAVQQAATVTYDVVVLDLSAADEERSRRVSRPAVERRRGSRADAHRARRGGGSHRRARRGRGRLPDQAVSFRRAAGARAGADASPSAPDAARAPRVWTARPQHPDAGGAGSMVSRSSSPRANMRCSSISAASRAP